MMKQIRASTAEPALGNLPAAYARRRWRYLDRANEIVILGGYVGVAQDQETLTLDTRSAAVWKKYLR